MEKRGGKKGKKNLSHQISPYSTTWAYRVRVGMQYQSITAICLSPYIQYNSPPLGTTNGKIAYGIYRTV